MSLARNNIVRVVRQGSLFESAKAVIDATVTINQGDLVAFDTVNNRLKAVTAGTDGENILGVARQTVVLGKVKSPYQGTAVDAAVALEDLAGPAYGVVAELVLKTGDALNPGDPVYASALDPQTVTAAAETIGDKSVGIYQGKVISAAAAGEKIETLLGLRYGVDSLLF